MENLILGHEGTRPSVYTDSQGKLHIGVGFNLDRPGAQQAIEAVGGNYEALCAGSDTLSTEQMETLFAKDLDAAIQGAEQSVVLSDHPEEVQSAIVDMVYNLGPTGFEYFVKMRTCLEAKDYCGAAAEMANSLWATQVPNRAADDIALVRQHCNS
jgi:GH24 family phage-related lysozyme (muramidase)